MKVRYKDEETESEKQTKHVDNSLGCDCVATRSNRDSGYNDDAFSVDSSYESLSPTSTVNDDINHRHLSNSEAVAHVYPKYPSKYITQYQIKEATNADLKLLGNLH